MPVDDPVSRGDGAVVAFVDGSANPFDGSVNAVDGSVEGLVSPVDGSAVALVDGLSSPAEGSVTALEACCSASRTEGFRSMALASSTCDGAESCGALLGSADADWVGAGRGESPVKLSAGSRDMSQVSAYGSSKLE